MKFFHVFLLLSSFCLHAQNEMFRGGFSDGYDHSEIIDPINLIAHGGNSDGYFLGQFINVESSLFNGGFADGYSKGNHQNLTFLGSLGGFADGYAGKSWIRKYWTGEVNVDWHNVGNWSDAAVPTFIDELIIPADCSFYPVLSGQFLLIGQQGLASNHECQTIWIQQNASITGNTSTVLENSKLLTIDGLLLWKNNGLNAVFNKPGAVIKIGSSGLLQIQN